MYTLESGFFYSTLHFEIRPCCYMHTIINNLLPLLDITLMCVQTTIYISILLAINIWVVYTSQLTVRTIKLFEIKINIGCHNIYKFNFHPRWPSYQVPTPWARVTGLPTSSTHFIPQWSSCCILMFLTRETAQQMHPIWPFL